MHPKQSSSSGGDYWITSTSALSNAFRDNDSGFIVEKIDQLLGAIEQTEHSTTKSQFQRNINILRNFEDFDFTKWHPEEDLVFLSKPKSISIFTVDGLPIQVRPNHVFSFERDGKNHIGAIWFVAVKEGYNITELSIFTDALFRYLKLHYSKDYVINKSLCVTVDAVSLKELDYNYFKEHKMKSKLRKTIAEIKAYLN